MKIVFPLIAFLMLAVLLIQWTNTPLEEGIEVTATPVDPLIADCVQPFVLNLNNQNQVDIKLLNVTFC